MPSAREIIAYTKEIRGKRGAFIRKHTNLVPSVDGQCVQVLEATDHFGGQHWRSEIAKFSPEQKYPGHSLGIVPTNNNAGVVIEYSRSHNFVRGSIQNINDLETVRLKLQEITGYAEWEKQ